MVFHSRLYATKRQQRPGMRHTVWPGLQLLWLQRDMWRDGRSMFQLQRRWKRTGLRMMHVCQLLQGKDQISRTAVQGVSKIFYTWWPPPCWSRWRSLPRMAPLSGEICWKRHWLRSPPPLLWMVYRHCSPVCDPFNFFDDLVWLKIWR